MSDRLDMLLSGSGLQLGKGNNYRDAAWLGECDKVGADIIFIFSSSAGSGRDGQAAWVAVRS